MKILRSLIFCTGQPPILCCITGTVGFQNFCFWNWLFRKLGKLTCPLNSIRYSVLWLNLEQYPFLTIANIEKISWDLMLLLTVYQHLNLNSYVAFQESIQNLVQNHLPKIRTFKPQHHRRSHHVVGHTAARRRFQLKSNSSLKIVTQ